MVVVGAADTFRAAAIDQLRIWCDRLKTEMVTGPAGADPASVAHDAIAQSRSRGVDVLIIDTAGRLHNKANLMRELEKMKRVIDKQLPGAPHEIWLVIDATTGGNAYHQAAEFHQSLGLTGLILTKLDGTSRGGIAVAIQNQLNVPIRFLGMGEQLDDLQPFNPKAFAEALIQ
jgi:fused signal recognition particle receptor